ncbi:adenylyltransferase/cytidyltransferase family protein [Streptomyces acidiscabies]|uniref:Adenylyltransferase/cytidyltransferase family protein n=1 Tax=Streptomyces acidiscabies TaxID=42234 RepID=A0ABU4MCF0_9ACTN|nr:adenylyltransferase/cytidyltransferase family protein [Streptomyces acidiscabies]MDX3025790.1 adenylyltransferase/cytidyltransferase family protein [Streptomyces acidiscabies]
MTAPRLSTGPAALDDIRAWLSSRPGDRAVLATGCFDLLHAGHLRYLEQARELGDLLVVGVNSDQSVRDLKGPSRPIVGEHERAALVSALKCVDRVFLYDEPTADRHIRFLRPAVFATARASITAYPSEAECAAAVGAHVHAIDRNTPYSTTRLVDALRAHP